MSFTKFKTIVGGLLVAGVLAWSNAPAAVAQQEVAGTQPVGTNEAAEETAGESSTVAPVIKEYKGVRIGMSADAARAALGGEEGVKNKQDVFLISDDEMAQLFFDKEGKLQAVSVTYMSKSDAPTATATLGMEVPAGADGRVYKLMRYPEVGYWVSYSRTAGDSPIVTVTIKKMITR